MGNTIEDYQERHQNKEHLGNEWVQIKIEGGPGGNEASRSRPFVGSNKQAGRKGVREQK